MTALVVAFQYGTPALLFILIVLQVWSMTKIKDLINSVNNLKEGVIWNDRFGEFKEAMETRVKRLEDKANGRR